MTAVALLNERNERADRPLAPDQEQKTTSGKASDAPILSG